MTASSYLLHPVLLEDHLSHVCPQEPKVRPESNGESLVRGSFVKDTMREEIDEDRSK